MTAFSRLTCLLVACALSFAPHIVEAQHRHPSRLEALRLTLEPLPAAIAPQHAPSPAPTSCRRSLAPALVTGAIFAVGVSAIVTVIDGVHLATLNPDARIRDGNNVAIAAAIGGVAVGGFVYWLDCRDRRAEQPGR